MSLVLAEEKALEDSGSSVNFLVNPLALASVCIQLVWKTWALEHVEALSLYLIDLEAISLVVRGSEHDGYESKYNG